MKIAVALILSFGFFSIEPSLADRTRIVTAAQVNGTWKSEFGTFKVWALGKQRLKVEFFGTYVYELADGSPMANSGEGAGIAIIEGDTATFKPDGAEKECSIEMQFIDRYLQVKQQSICGFGNNVTAAGRYSKINSQKPNFGEN